MSEITERWQEEVTDRWGTYPRQRRIRVDADGLAWQGYSLDGYDWLEVPEEEGHDDE